MKHEIKRTGSAFCLSSRHIGTRSPLEPNNIDKIERTALLDGSNVFRQLLSLTSLYSPAKELIRGTGHGTWPPFFTAESGSQR